jgi:hypothetical protein
LRNLVAADGEVGFTGFVVPVPQLCLEIRAASNERVLKVNEQGIQAFGPRWDTARGGEKVGWDFLVTVHIYV